MTAARQLKVSPNRRKNARLEGLGMSELYGTEECIRDNEIIK